MRRKSGIALITVLVFLQILAVLGLYAMQMALYETKQAQFVYRKHVAHQKAEEALHHAEYNLMNGLVACFIPVASTSELLSHSMEWWRSISCAGNFLSFQYYYVTEFLGTDECGFTEMLPNKVTADYYRITVLGVAGDVKVMLQSALVLPSRAGLVKDCYKTGHKVKIGRQMWRELA